MNIRGTVQQSGFPTPRNIHTRNRWFSDVQPDRSQTATSNVASILEHLECQSLESRRAKAQLTVLLNIIHEILGIDDTHKNKKHG